MKNRFNSDDYEDYGNFEDMDEAYMSEEEYEKLLAQANELQEVQLQLAQLDLNQRLLAETIEMLQKNPSWRRKSMKMKLKEVGLAYKYFEKLTDPRGNMPQK